MDKFVYKNSATLLQMPFVLFYFVFSSVLYFIVCFRLYSSINAVVKQNNYLTVDCHHYSSQ